MDIDLFSSNYIHVFVKENPTVVKEHVSMVETRNPGCAVTRKGKTLERLPGQHFGSINSAALKEKTKELVLIYIIMVVRRFSRMGFDMLLKFSKKCAKKTSNITNHLHRERFRV